MNTRSGSVVLKPVTGELQVPTVLGDGPDDVIRGAVWEPGFDLQGDRAICTDLSRQVRDHLFGDVASDLNKLTQYPVWYASYIRKTHKVGPENKLRGWKEWDIWQYGSKGVVSGIPGKVDVNWMAGDQLKNLTMP